MNWRVQKNNTKTLDDEYSDLLIKLEYWEERTNAADWMWLDSEWSEIRMELVHTRKRIKMVKEAIRDSEV